MKIFTTQGLVFDHDLENYLRFLIATSPNPHHHLSKLEGMLGHDNLSPINNPDPISQQLERIKNKIQRVKMTQKLFSARFDRSIKRWEAVKEKAQEKMQKKMSFRINRKNI